MSCIRWVIAGKTVGLWAFLPPTPLCDYVLSSTPVDVTQTLGGRCLLRSPIPLWSCFVFRPVVYGPSKFPDGSSAGPLSFLVHLAS